MLLMSATPLNLIIPAEDSKEERSCSVETQPNSTTTTSVIRSFLGLKQDINHHDMRNIPSDDVDLYSTARHVLFVTSVLVIFPPHNTFL